MRLRIFILLMLVGLVSACAGKPTAQVAKSAKIPAVDQVQPLAPSVPGYSIRVNIPERVLYLKQDGKVIKNYSVAVGQGRYPTPVKQFTIEQIVWNPWWIPPDSDWAAGASKTPPGPNNPLGPVKMIMQEAVLIHGTNKPGSIGQPASHGCIRMYKEQAEELAWTLQSQYSDKSDPQLKDLYKKKKGQSFYVNLNQGVPVEVTYDTVEVADGQLVIHPDIYRRKGGLKQQIEQLLHLQGKENIQIKDEQLKNIQKLLQKGKVIMPMSDLVYSSMISAL